MQKRGADVVLNNTAFDRIEANVLNEVTEVAKSLINTFKFQIIYSANVSKQREMKTLKLIKNYRTQCKKNKINNNYLKDLFPSK